MLQTREYRGLGLMSGSSLDGIDIAFCRFLVRSGQTGQTFPLVVDEWEMPAAETRPFDPSWRRRLRELPAGSARELALAHVEFGQLLAHEVTAFLAAHPVRPSYIASHGHTIFHWPERGATLQIGDGGALAARTGLPVVCDFRSQDVALQGQGAPMAPIAERLLFDGYDLFLNLGGIANISSGLGGEWRAYDVAPANQVLDRLAQQEGKAFDENGRLAASGQLLEPLLAQLDDLPYYRRPFPKSLDNSFSSEEVWPLLAAAPGSWADRSHTYCEHLARQIARSVRELAGQAAARMLVTGGGAFHAFLVDRLRVHCGPVEVIVPEARIVAFKEAALMALAGMLRLEGLPNFLPSVTGAGRASVGGAWYAGSEGAAAIFEPVDDSPEPPRH
ncbi:MAG: anhydro-N-acetylmuramic acid kinase [Saprospiraceae bacterium]|nr:anhydro-N-acetylmuramic acid kinase [Saprospiraceae bacterium]MCB0623587.1 anhydro-N-acetylmuramic acid kinase [Saprospiraceae bacterium]